ncbi:hypothetical protein BC567DRAFT_238069 [Phyllosticta citribraziliensis]
MFPVDVLSLGWINCPRIHLFVVAGDGRIEGKAGAVPFGRRSGVYGSGLAVGVVPGRERRERSALREGNCVPDGSALGVGVVPGREGGKGAYLETGTSTGSGYPRLSACRRCSASWSSCWRANSSSPLLPPLLTGPGCSHYWRCCRAGKEGKERSQGQPGTAVRLPGRVIVGGQTPRLRCCRRC